MKRKPGRILTFLKPFRGPIIQSIILTGILTVLGMISPLILKYLIDDVVGAGRWDKLLWVAVGLFLIPVIREGINIFNGIVVNRIGIGIIGKTRRDIFSHLMKLSLQFYEEHPVGSLKERLFGDVATISGAATGGFITLFTDIFVVLFAVSMMIRLNLLLTVLTFALLPFYYLNYLFFSKRIRSTTAVIRSRMDHISTMLQERLGAHELIKSYGQEKAETLHFSSQAKQIMDASIRGSAYSISFDQMVAFINKVGNTLLYCAGCYLFIKGQTEYGSVVAFCAYASQLLGPIVRFATVSNQFVQIGVSVDRISDILEQQPAIRDTDTAQAVASLSGQIDIKGLSFSYESGKPVLEEVTLSIPSGSDIALVGTFGAGRSTLARLLRRLYEPDGGSIEVDGHDIRSFRLADYRRQIALVLPESAVFDGSFRYNLCYGNLDATEDQMIRYSKAVGLHDFVLELHDGYDTRIGSGGLRLSAGNRQRVGIARALISDPLILIADEATASLDPISAEEINDALLIALQDRTYVMIAHRMLLAKKADTIIVLSNGTVRETGSHAQLIKKKDGLYRKLFTGQYGEEMGRDEETSETSGGRE